MTLYGKLVAVFIMFLLVVVSVLVGLLIIVNTNEQSKENYSAIEEAKVSSEQNQALLRIILAVTECTVTDTPEQCRQRQVNRAFAEGIARVAEVDCRTRAALANKPPIPPDQRCTDLERKEG